MSYTAERRQEEKDRRRAEIVEAAIELYREVGWDTVTVDQVAKRARLSRALVYVYFKDKEELHLSIVLHSFEILEKRMAEAASRVRLGLDKVEAMGRSYLAFAHELPHFFDACARFEAGGSPTDDANALQSACFEAGHRVHLLCIAALETGLKDGSVSAEIGDLNMASSALWGFSHGLIQIAMTKAHVLAHDGVSVPQFIDHSIALLRRMLAN